MKYFFFSIWVFFQEHLRITGLQGKGESISLTPRYHFHLLHRHLDINWAITAESSPLHITSSQTRTGNLWFSKASRSFLFPMESLCICIHAYLLSNCGISTVKFVYLYSYISFNELGSFCYILIEKSNLLPPLEHEKASKFTFHLQ